MSGFINQFATVIDAQGKRQLNASHVGLWAAINYVTQAVAQFTSPLTANKFGLRFNMWLFTLFKLLVSQQVNQPRGVILIHEDNHHRDRLH